MKKCFKCKNIFNETFFRKSYQKIKPKDGLQGICKKCSREIGRKKVYKQRYGISWEEKLEMIKEQNGICLICSSLLLEEGNTTCIDHCHKTNKIRGIICGHCNSLLGYAKDDVTILQSAINYLKSS